MLRAPRSAPPPARATSLLAGTAALLALGAAPLAGAPALLARVPGPRAIGRVVGVALGAPRAGPTADGSAAPTAGPTARDAAAARPLPVFADCAGIRSGAMATDAADCRHAGRAPSASGGETPPDGLRLGDPAARLDGDDPRGFRDAPP